MKSPILALSIALVAAGCANQMEIASAPVEVTRSSAFPQQNFVGNHPVTVRSYTLKANENGRDDRTEFAGAACQIRGNGFTASFSTPAIVNFPDHGFRSQAVSGSCRVGDTTRAFASQPYNITVENIRSNTGAGGGMIGILAAGIANSIAIAANDVENDDFGYRNITIDFPKGVAE